MSGPRASGELGNAPGGCPSPLGAALTPNAVVAFELDDEGNIVLILADGRRAVIDEFDGPLSRAKILRLLAPGPMHRYGSRWPSGLRFHRHAEIIEGKQAITFEVRS